MREDASWTVQCHFLPLLLYYHFFSVNLSLLISMHLLRVAPSHKDHIKHLIKGLSWGRVMHINIFSQIAFAVISINYLLSHFEYFNIIFQMIELYTTDILINLFYTVYYSIRYEIISFRRNSCFWSLRYEINWKITARDNLAFIVESPSVCNKSYSSAEGHYHVRIQFFRCYINVIWGMYLLCSRFWRNKTRRTYANEHIPYVSARNWKHEETEEIFRANSIQN